MILKFFIFFTFIQLNSYAGFSARKSSGLILNNLVAHFDSTKANLTNNSAYSSGTGCSTNQTWYDIKGTQNAILANFDTCTTTGWLNTPNRLSKDATDDSITINDHPNFSFTNGSGTDRPFSIEIWANVSDSGSNRTLISKMSSTSNAEYVIWLSGSEGINAELVGTNWSSSRIGFYPTAALTTATWNQIVMTYDGSESPTGIKIYINGTLQTGTTSTTGTYTGMANTTGNVNIGSWDGGQFFLGGSYAIIRIYNIELTQSQIRRNCRMQANRFSISCS